MTTVGFIGLGIMGGPMAANLVTAGHKVAGFNRSPAKIDALVEKGGTAAKTVADAVRDAEVVITIVLTGEGSFDEQTLEGKGPHRGHPAGQQRRSTGRGRGRIQRVHLRRSSSA